MKILKQLFIIHLSLFICMTAHAASVVATIGGTPITDADINARVALMNKQGDTSTDNRKRALSNIIDDSVKLSYAENFKLEPADSDVDKELKAMELGELSATERAAARSAVAANMAWNNVIARTIMPTIQVADSDIAAERAALAADRGLPLEMTIVRLTDIPSDIAAKLTKPKSCDAAVDMAEKLGGAPQKFTAVQYELSADIRERVANLPVLTWSPRTDDSVLLVCSVKKTAEYGKLDEIIKQNAMYKSALFAADQQLKQLRRRAVVIIQDERYK